MNLELDLTAFQEYFRISPVYAFPPGFRMQLNPFGPQDETRERAARILEVISERSLETVCGYNFITEFDGWREDFKRLLAQAR